MFESICKSILIICAALLAVPCHAADLKAPAVALQVRELEEARQKIAALQTQLADRGKVISMSLAASASEAATARLAVDKERGAANKLREEIALLKTELERQKLSNISVKADNDRLVAEVARLRAEIGRAGNEKGALKAALEKERIGAGEESGKRLKEIQALKEAVASCKLAAEQQAAAGGKLKTENERQGKVIAEKNAALDSAIKLLSALKPKSASIPKIAGEEYVEEALGPVVVERGGGKVIVAVAGGAEQKADARFFGAITEKRRSEDGRVVFTLDPLRLKRQ